MKIFDQYRVGVIGLVHNKKGEFLFCKMPKDRGMFPGQWALPGGGMEPEETMEEALKRELLEEVGLTVVAVTPFYFTDDHREKLFADGSKKLVYMIYLLFDCEAVSEDIRLNGEFEAYAWVKPEHIRHYDFNEPTVETLKRKGLWQ